MAQFSLAELNLLDGLHAGAGALLEEIEERGLDELFGHRGLGEGYARCASLASDDGSLAPVERDDLVARHTRRGIEHLSRAIELGYDDLGLPRARLRDRGPASVACLHRPRRGCA